MADLRQTHLRVDQSESEAITQREIAHLKKRRDQLLNTACNRFERAGIFEEVKRINARLRVLHVKLGRQPADQA